MMTFIIPMNQCRSWGPALNCFFIASFMVEKSLPSITIDSSSCNREN